LFLSLMHFGGTFFSSDAFVFEPLAFWGCLFFQRMSLFFSPLHFGLHLFRSEVFIFKPLVFWGCLFFYRRSLFFSPLHFGVAFFLSDVFVFEPMNEGPDSAPPLMASYVFAKALVKC
jgi:hypothetical protein